jgi:methylmalonyl-CoA mutase cobalamin-binding subunit
MTLMPPLLEVLREQGIAGIIVIVGGHGPG